VGFEREKSQPRNAERSEAHARNVFV